MLLREYPGAAEHGGARVEQGDNITLNARGTSSSHTLKHLKRDNPELAEKVIQGELSANAAAIEAGFRKKTISINSNPEAAAASIKKNLGDEFSNQLRAEPETVTLLSQCHTKTGNNRQLTWVD